MKRLAVLSALVPMLSGCGTGLQYPAGPATTLEGGLAQYLQVFANGDWRDTGVQVKRGETYRVTAEGRWSSGVFCGYTDASGSGVNPLCGGDPWNLGVGGSSMIGRIGNGPPFPVGSALTFIARDEGHLHLRDYDLMEFDNSGTMNVMVTRAAPAAHHAAPPPPPPPPPQASTPPAPVASRFPEQPLTLRFPKGAERPDDVAVIIGNADYTRQGRDIPDARPAHADAAGVRRYAIEALGVKEGNVIFMKDATGSQMTSVFGSRDDHRGQLFDWVKPGKSRVFVYYSGHGAPGVQGGSPYLVPADSDAARIELNGYPLKQLYDNLGKLPADSVTVVLEACFSGVSPAGSVLGKASPVFLEAKAPVVPDNVTLIAAGNANQMASWEPDDSHGMFTRNFLEGMAGKADADRNGKVSLDELERHLNETLTYAARRNYGRDQNAQIVRGK